VAAQAAHFNASETEMVIRWEREDDQLEADTFAPYISVGVRRI